MIVVLTGAGVSQESGLATFRCADGIWSKVRIEDVATPEAFRANPARVHEFYNARRTQLLDPAVRPNAAHRALARLEAESKREVVLVTQNIDDLHERGGSRGVLHMHGELLKSRCVACGHVAECRTDLSLKSTCANCRRGGCLRPDVVWFGEAPMHMEHIYKALADCDLFVSVGTSGNVYPAAGFVREARSAGAHTAELNLEPSEGSGLFDERLYGPATRIVPAFVDRLLAESS